jgi:hypothetical protein
MACSGDRRRTGTLWRNARTGLVMWRTNKTSWGSKIGWHFAPRWAGTQSILRRRPVSATRDCCCRTDRRSGRGRSRE